MEQEEIDRKNIQLKIYEYQENISHLYYQFVEKQRNFISQEENDELVQKSSQSSEVIFYDQYNLLIQSYPVTEDFSQFSITDMEDFYDCFHEHHIKTMETAYQLLTILDDNLRQLHQKIMELPPNNFSASHKK